jgi:hypothetical protein
LNQRSGSLSGVAYHGTPHVFENFSLDSINTGQKAQAFGWGLYFTQTREVADRYREDLSLLTLRYKGQLIQHVCRNNPACAYVFRVMYARLRGKLSQNGLLGSVEWALNEVRAQIEIDERGHPQHAEAFLNQIDPRDVQISKGCIYEVEIPDDAELLDYETAVVDQPRIVEKMRRAGVLREDKFGSVILVKGMDRDAFPHPVDIGVTGGQLYVKIANLMSLDRSTADRRASNRLLRWGIPGLRYFDGVSCGVQRGTYNYVIWDDTRIRVLNRSC